MTSLVAVNYIHPTTPPHPPATAMPRYRFHLATANGRQLTPSRDFTAEDRQEAEERAQAAADAFAAERGNEKNDEPHAFGWVGYDLDVYPDTDPGGLALALYEVVGARAADAIADAYAKHDEEAYCAAALAALDDQAAYTLDDEPVTLPAFLRDNFGPGAAGLDPDDLRAALTLKPGDSANLGGGAAAGFALRRTS